MSAFSFQSSESQSHFVASIPLLTIRFPPFFRQSWLKKKPDATDNDSFGDFDFGTTVWKASPGTGFGQIALITKNPIRSGSCIASAPNTALLAIPKRLYNQYLAHLHQAEKNLDARVAFFKSLSHFKHWSHARLMRK